MAEQTVELAPGESKEVSFEATPHEAKTYQVSVDGLMGSFKAIAKPLIIDLPQLSILRVDGMPFASVVGTEATLAEPITMSKMRGVTLTCLWKTWVSPSQWITYSVMAYLWYEPAFFAEMPPPAFRSGYLPYPTSEEAAQQPVEIGVAGRFAAGYYYPGIYNGKFQFQSFYDGYGGTPFANFRIKNLARVTGEGTV